MKLRRVLLVLLCTLPLFNLNAVAAPDRQLELSRECLELSGLGAALDSIPEQIDASIQQQKLTAKDPELLNLYGSIIRESFDADRAREDLHAYIAANLDRSTLESLDASLKQVWVQRIVEEELLATGTAVEGEKLQFIANLKSAPPAQERIDLMLELEAAAKMSETATKMAVKVLRGMTASAAVYLPQAEQEELNRNVETTLAQMIPAMRKNLHQQMVVYSFYTYRNVSDRDLRRYVDYTRSDEVQTFLTVAQGGLMDILEQNFIDAADKFFAILKSRS